MLALVGAALQHRKKERLQPDAWRAWERRTSNTPSAAMLTGRVLLHGFGLHTLHGGLVFWLAATRVHIPLPRWAAGVWRWMRKR